MKPLGLVLLLAGQVAAQSGVLVLQVDPPATVYVDGALVTANAIIHHATLPTGPHRIRVTHPAYEDLLRVESIANGAIVDLRLSLIDDAIPKRPTGRLDTRRLGASVTSTELAQGIDFVNQGDFAPAVEVLEATSRSLANVPRYLREHAIASVYLGVALAGLRHDELATRAFAIARLVDSSVAPTPAEFSRRIMVLWAQSQSLTVDDTTPPSLPDKSEPLVKLPEPPPVDATDVNNAVASTETGTTTPSLPNAAPDTPPATAATDGEFITVLDNTTTLQMVLVVSAGTPCAGTLQVAKPEQVVSWSPADLTCGTSFKVPFRELRTPAAAPNGGVLLQFRSDRPSMVLMPAPDADLVQPGVEKMLMSELPPSTVVNIRRAHKQITTGLGRTMNDSIFGLQVDVPLEQLVANPADYEGLSVRTRGTLAFDSNRGPFHLTVAGSNLVQLLPSGVAAAVIQSNAAQWKAKEILVSGTFSRAVTSLRRDNNRATAPLLLMVSSFESPEMLAAGPAQHQSIQEVLRNPPAANAAIKLIGRYRGSNRFGDLPLESRRKTDDWIIKQGAAAIWITGKPASSNGFSLSALTDAENRAPWVTVTGTVEEIKGFLYLHADKVELSVNPPDATTTRGAGLGNGDPKIAPVIAFTAPMEKVEEAGRDQQFLIRFNKPMLEPSFAGNVLVRYADARDTPFKNVSVTYYEDRTFSIMVDPGAALRPGKVLEIVFLPGAMDRTKRSLTDAGQELVLSWTVR